MATEAKRYTDAQLSPFRKMGEIRLLQTTQLAEDVVGLMNGAKKIGIGLGLVNEVVRFGMEKAGKAPNKTSVSAARLLCLGIAVGGFIGERYYNPIADKAATVLAERVADPRFTGTKRYLEDLAGKLFDKMDSGEER